MKRRPPLALIAAALISSAAVGGAGELAPTPPAAREGNDLDRLLARLTEEERALAAERDRIGPAIEVANRRMLARARAYVKHLRAGVLPAGGGFDALVDYAATVERTRRALDRDREAEAALRRRLSEIEVELARIRVMRAPLDVQREAMARARMALQQADERRAAFARAFETSVRPPDYMAIYGADSGPSDGSSANAGRSGGFEALKGRLPLPVSGRAEARRVMRRGAGGPGLELQAIPGATARSVAAGRVAFADVYDDYGLTVILDHGGSYYSVYGGLGRIDVRVGENAPENARLGALGGSGALPAVLYFEIRHRADTVDPGPWLGL
jgi:septal ring factor EnvC (AmiA/AmiB activator)